MGQLNTSFEPITNHRGSWVQKTCRVCGKDFYCHPSRKDVRKNCSRKCQFEATRKRMTGLRREEHPSFIRGYYIDKKGYKQVLVDGDDRHICGHYYRAEHVLKAEKALGRRLRKGEVVHHIDCDKRNNSNDNLLICDNGYHQWLHYEMSNRYAEKFLKGGGNNRR